MDSQKNPFLTRGNRHTPREILNKKGMSSLSARRKKIMDSPMSSHNCYEGVQLSKLDGMVDAHAHHNSGATCPLPLIYEQIRNEEPAIKPTKMKRRWVELLIGLYYASGVKIQKLTTRSMGRLLTNLNTAMFNKNNSVRTFDEYKKILKKKKKMDALTETVPSLIIVPTMDMELAHLDGYKGEFIYIEDGDKVYYKKRVSVSETQPLGVQEKVDISHERIKPSSTKNSKNEESEKTVNSDTDKLQKAIDDDDSLKFQKWKRQISETELAAASNPLRLLPLFFYDPRRYRLPNSDLPGEKDCAKWNEPFTHIIKYSEENNGISEKNKIWFGFKMYPSLGYRPFDEFCDYLLDFYEECEDNKIPILTHCAPGGMTTHEAQFYEEFDESNERKKAYYKIGGIRSNTFNGQDEVDNDKKMDYFYKTYGHPHNWLPVLEKYKNLHLCLAHFGGDSEWGHQSMRKWSEDNNDTSWPPREWIKEIIKLTKDYPNVYTDISCLNLNLKYTGDKCVCKKQPQEESNEESNCKCVLTIKGALKELLRLIWNNKENEDCALGNLYKKLIFGSDWYLTYLTDIAKPKKNAEYSRYCNEFKKLFYEIDRDGYFWERVSLINPWNCYSLSEKKFGEMHENLRALVGKNNERSKHIKSTKHIRTNSSVTNEPYDLLCGLDDYVKNKSK